jgi:hypothetical protein
VATRSLTIPLRAETADALKAMQGVRTNFDDLRAKFERSSLKVNMDDRAARIQFRELGIQMDKLDKRTARPKVTLEGAERAALQLDKLNLKMDELGAKSEALGGIRSRTGRFGGNLLKSLGSSNALQGLVTGNEGTAGGLGSFLTSPLGLGALGLGVGLIPGAVGGLAGLGIGGAGLMLADKADPKGFARALSPVSGVLHGVGASVAKDFIPVLRQIAGFIKSIGPDLRNMFGASVPVIGQFVRALEPAVRQALPQLTMFLNTLVKSGLMTDLGKAFGLLLVSSTKALNGLSVGFKASGKLIVQVARVMGAAIELLGRTIGGIVRIVDDLIHGKWNSAWTAALSTVRDFARIIDVDLGNLAHNIANVFDMTRHEVSVIWDAMWTGVKNEVHMIGPQLESLGKAALGMLWSGFKSIGSGILGWFKGFGSSVLGALKSVFGIASPSRAMFEIGHNLGLGLEHGLKSRFAPIKATVGHLGGSVTSWIVEALKLSGKPMSWLPALSRLVSLESGGNPRAVDPISVLGQHASGLWQMLPSTFYGYGGRGSLFNPITEGVAALRYIASRYGSPFSIPGLFGGGYRGYAKGGWITEPVIGMGVHSGIKYAFGENAPAVPEYVGPAGHGSGDVYNIMVQGDTNPDAAALRIIQLLRKYKTRHGNLSLNFG